MDEKLLAQLNKDNARRICAKIKEEAQTEAATILARASLEAEKALASAQEEAGAQRAAILKELGRDIQKLKEKSFSSLNLEKKRLVLGEKDKFVEEILDAVKRQAGEFRTTEGYTRFLEQAAAEGAQVIEGASLRILYSYQDAGIFTDGFIKKISESCSGVLKKPCSVKAEKADFKDLGVIVSSSDGRMMFDNRFLSRLARMKEDVSMELLKGIFAATK